MYEKQAEERYKSRINNSVLYCVVAFCLFRISVELLENHLEYAIMMAIASCIGLLLFLILWKKDAKVLPFFAPFFMYTTYLGVSFVMDSFKYFYAFYMLTLIVCASYFSVKNYFAFISITQIVNVFLSIFVLQKHVTGNVWVLYVLTLGACVLLLAVVKFAVSRSNEVNNAFASFGALMRVTPNVLILIGRDNRIEYLSKSVSRVFGIQDLERWTGKNFLDMFSEKSIKDLFESIVEKRSFYGDYQKININGEIKTFDVVADRMSSDVTDGMFFMLNDVSEIIRLKELAEQDSLMDALVQIPNRRAFDRQIFLEWNRALRDKVNLSFLMIDIDFFKKYNDTYGHLQGDELLKAAGKTFKSSLKRSTDFIARVGGEEFAVLLYATNSYQANVIAERIRKAVEEEVVLTSSGEKTKFTISVGVVTLIPHTGMEYSVIIEEADKALYNAKQNGRNRVWIADYKY